MSRSGNGLLPVLVIGAGVVASIAVMAALKQTSGGGPGSLYVPTDGTVKR